MKKTSNHLNIKDVEIFFLFCLSFILSFSYLVWRVIFTIDYSIGIIDLIWPFMLLMAETYSFIVFSSFSFASINVRKNKLSTKTKDINYFPTVDIFICTYNESENILRDTILGCKNIKYKKANKKIYLLDDGNRPAIKQLAADFEINYIARTTNKGFKAGNINNALKKTDSEFIVVFDADHIPVSTFLIELIDFFKDEKIAIVQTPQHFLNPDPFQKNLDLTKQLTNEQDLFFRIIQPGLSQWNAAICSGTNFIIRRKALEQIGGLPESSITEDMDLGMRLESIGLVIKYYNKPLAAGLAPETFQDYLNQRLRWCTGTIQTFLFNKDTIFKNLTFPQKCFYSSGIFYYFLGFPRIVFLLSPMLYLLFNIKPLSAPLHQVAIFLIVCYGVKIHLFRKLAKKYRNFLFTDVYETAIAHYMSIAVIKTIINPRTPKFTITSKDVGVAHTNYKLFLPQLIMLILALVSFIFPVYELYKHIHSLEALALNLVFNLYNTIILIFSVDVALEKKEKRQGRRVAIKLQANLENYKKNKTNIEVMNISKTGALLFSRRDRSDEFEAILEDENSLILPNNEKIDLKLIKTYKKGHGRYYNVKFDLDSKEKEDKLLKIAFKNSNNW